MCDGLMMVRIVHLTAQQKNDLTKSLLPAMNVALR